MGENGLLRTKHLVAFQADGVAQTHIDQDKMWVWDTGLGKSVGSVALAALGFDQGTIDQVLVVCERNKIREWIKDFVDETDLTIHKMHGANRWRKLTKDFPDRWPDVLVTTYETAKTDAIRKVGPRKLERGPLLDHLLGKRLLVIYDESNKLKNRSSMTYKAHAYMLGEMRRKGNMSSVRVLALTGTPIDTDYEDVFSQLRLVVPQAMPMVKKFEEICVSRRDRFGRPVFNKAGVQAFMEVCRPHLIRKRKTDADVVDQFPAMTENFRYVEMTPDHRDLYRTVEKHIFESEMDEGSSWMTLRQLAGHPAALIHAARRSEGSQLAKQIVSILGEDHLSSIRCAKAEELESYLETVVKQQGDKAMVFTFFGRSILRCLHQMLTGKGYAVFTYHGENSAGQNETSLGAFKSHHAGAVLLSSDAGAKGINVPEATYVVEYDAPTTYSLHVQRLNRAHRLGHNLGPVTGLTLATEGTLEEDILASLIRRNEMHDAFVGDTEAEGDHTLAADRKAILAKARSRYQKR
jgi:SNF2 family DNA or RNA helicase